MVLEAIEKWNAKAPPVSCEGHVIHLALVVPDIRLFQLLKSKALIIQPPYDNVRVELHILVEDKKDPLKDMPWDIRVALVQSGLANARDANIHPPDQVTLGWPTEDTE